MHPSLSGRTVVCVSSIDWDDCWQAPQQICCELVRLGAKVLYVENTTVRGPALGDWSRIGQRIKNFLSNHKRSRRLPPGLWLCSPLVAPFPYTRWARWFNRWWGVRSITAWSRQHPGAPIFLTFLPTPFALDVHSALHPQASLYCCAARFAESSAGARPIQAYEAEMVRRCDWTLTFARDLEQHCRELGGRVHRMPLGVDMRVFEPAWRQPPPCPAELVGLSGPIIGYIGGLHGVLDQQLLIQLSLLRPDWNLVLVGPEVVPSPALRGRPNILCLGQRPHARLPAYLAHFQVGLVPYLVNAYSAGVYPSKLMEYLAMGKPVVSTPLPEIRIFNQEFGDLVEVGENAHEFAHVIQQQLVSSPAEVERRRQVALANDWAARVQEIISLL